MFRWNGLAFLHSFQHFMTILLNISGNKNYVHKYFTTLKCPPFLIIMSSCRLRHNKQGRRQVSFDINKWHAMTDELLCHVSRVTRQPWCVMWPPSALHNGLQLTGGRTVSASQPTVHCSLSLRTPPPAPARTDGSSLAAAANVGVDKAKSFELLYYCMDTLNKNWNE